MAKGGSLFAKALKVFFNTRYTPVFKDIGSSSRRAMTSID
jgi:hypothetical protein